MIRRSLNPNSVMNDGECGRHKFYDPKSGISIMAYVCPEGWVKMDDWTPELRKEAKMTLLRVERDRRLAETDWMASPDMPISEDETNEIWSYRQALRDLPQQPGAPWDGEEIPWPEKPTIHPAQMVITTAPWLKEKTEAHYTPKGDK